ncbi:MAG: hypothetical protein JW751_15670 [Polyangiaceae bacterium]|nr:hypothetical protein [Polyangiaceae bacterium]
MRRRAFLLASLAAGSGIQTARAAPVEAPEVEPQDLRLDGDPRIARRALLLVPRHRPRDAPLRLLVLLHGLGETGDELSGIHAWSERYGLVRAYERLRRPPVTPVDERLGYLTVERQQELARDLAQRPFEGLALVCPVTPAPHRVGVVAHVLDRYASWLVDTLLPAVRARVNLAPTPWSIGLDGCSLGGYVALEVFLRHPEVFGTLGTVQGAFKGWNGRDYADRLARTLDRVGPRPIHVESSSWDPYREGAVALSNRLTEFDVPHVLRIPPGPHDQPWLREVGSLEMLLWHDRTLLG